LWRGLWTASASPDFARSKMVLSFFHWAVDIPSSAATCSSARPRWAKFSPSESLFCLRLASLFLSVLILSILCSSAPSRAICVFDFSLCLLLLIFQEPNGPCKIASSYNLAAEKSAAKRTPQNCVGVQSRCRIFDRQKG
jgi:hypothetical protein